MDADTAPSPDAPRNTPGASLRGLITTSAPGPRSLDAVVVGLGLVLVVAGLALRPDLALPGPTVAVTLAMIAMLPWRRRHPLLVVAGVTLVNSALVVTKSALGLEQVGMDASVVLLSVPFALFRYGNEKMRPMGGLLLAVALSLSLSAGGGGFSGTVFGLALVFVAVLSGVLLRERAAARSRELEMARSLERESLARDLHDTVAHHVTTIAIRAQVARAVPEDRALVNESLEVIEAESQAALAEMRSLVRVLRTPVLDATALTPAFGLDHLAALADPGPPRVTVEIDGIASSDGSDGSEGTRGSGGARIGQILATTLVRLAQEGVTNARRHARGATLIEVTVRATAQEVVLMVRDDGAPATSRTPAVGVGDGFGAGHGVTGMRERTARLGGTFEAGPADSGGWMLRAALPARPTGEAR